MGVSLQAGINGNLKDAVGSPVLASLISFIVGSAALFATYIIAVSSAAQAVPSLSDLKHTSWWMWTGGLLGAFYVLMLIVIVPRIGFANMFSLTIGGQIVLTVILDHLGAFGNQVHPISPLRVAGLVLLIAGVYIIQTN